MTVVAAFSFSEHPMIFGDLLLSGPEVAGRSGSIPSVGDVRNVFPEGSGWTITGLAQKVVIVSDECAVGWAGSHLAARVAIKALRELASRQVLTPDSVEGLLKELGPDIDPLGLSLVGFIRAHDGFARIVRDADLSMQMAEGTDVLLAGSGTQSVGKILKTCRPRWLREGSGGPHPAQRAYEFGLQLGGMYLRMEGANDEQLLQYFGGAYEVAVYDGQRFTKGSGVTYVLWEGKEHDRNGFAFPQQIITTNYKDGALLMRSQMLKLTENSSFDTEMIQVHFVGPIYSRDRDIGPLTPSSIVQETPWIVHSFLLRMPKGIRQLAISQHPRYDGTDIFSIEEQQGCILKVNWKKEFWSDLQEAVNGMGN